MSVYRFISEVPPSWRCGYCWEEDIVAQGAIVAHENGGKSHPVHLHCMAAWRLKSSDCMACLCETDANAVMTSAMKLNVVAAAVLQNLKRTVRSPLFRLSVSIVLTVIGARKNQPLLSALGWFFQWLNIHQIILYGGRHIEVARKLERLCSELLIHFNAAQFQELKDLVALHASYAQILDKSDGIKQLFEALKKEIRGDQIIRLYRLVAAFSALRLALRACPLP